MLGVFRRIFGGSGTNIVWIVWNNTVEDYWNLVAVVSSSENADRVIDVLGHGDKKWRKSSYVIDHRMKMLVSYHRANSSSLD